MLISFHKVFARNHLQKTFKVICRSFVAVMSTAKPCILFVLGAPGSGKGTQCSKIVDKFNFVHLSAGDLLREERNTPGSPYGTLIETHITNGTIVPVEITCSLIERAIEKHAAKHILLDGFPRNEDNLSGWNRQMSEKVNILGVLFFECTPEACMERCLARGAAGSGRSDDNEESLRKRFVTYQNDTLPIINHYKDQNLVFTVDAIRNPDTVFHDVFNVITRIAPEAGK